MTMRRAALVLIGSAVITMTIGNASARTRDSSGGRLRDSTLALASPQNGCPIIFPAGPVAVAPNQPAAPEQSNVGIINALCDVTLDFVRCGFTPTTIAIGCDTNGDAVPDLLIPLNNIKVINGLLFQATIPALARTQGTAFPLACCGGAATITLSRTVTGGDNNVFGPFTQTITCSIDLGIRAPVVISASPSEGNCGLGQNLLIPGGCFTLARGEPNVTSVFAVDAANPNNVIQSKAFQVLNSFLIDAFFQFGAANSGKAFLIFASGPNGTSRNLTRLPVNAPNGCPLGNEQGTAVSFKCRSTAGGVVDAAALTPEATGCLVERNEAGSFSLTIFGNGIREGATMMVDGLTPKKIRLRGWDSESSAFTSLTAKARFCENLPAAIVIVNPDGSTSRPLLCTERCVTQ